MLRSLAALPGIGPAEAEEPDSMPLPGSPGALASLGCTGHAHGALSETTAARDLQEDGTIQARDHDSEACSNGQNWVQEGVRERLREVDPENVTAEHRDH